MTQALKSEERSLSPTGLLLDVKMFANNFVRLLYSHIKKNNKRVAHSLTKNMDGKYSITYYFNFTIGCS